MKKKIFVFFIFMMSLTACKFSQHKASGKTAANYPMMDTMDIFDFSKVSNFKPSKDAVAYARNLYLSGIDLYANKHNAKESFPLLLLSARIAPNAYTYLKLGEVAHEVGMEDVAFRSFPMAMIDRNTKPMAEMWMARLSSNYGVPDGLDMLEQALKDYPFDIEAVKQDTFFKYLQDNEEFKLLMAKYSVSADMRKKVVLRMFAENFVKASLPYTIPTDSMNVRTGTNIDYMYSEIVTDLQDGAGRFSRMVEKSYEYVAEVNTSPSYHTFVYRAVHYFGDTFSPINYFVATVDTAGNTIGTADIGCFCSPITLKVPAIDSMGVIEVKEIKQTYKKDPLEAGYENNEVVKQDVMGITYYQIMPDGKIEPRRTRPGDTSGPAEANAPPKAPEVVQWKTQ